jgi:hypothetical protein
MRVGEPLPVPRFAPVLAYGVAGVAVVTVVLLVAARR